MRGEIAIPPAFDADKQELLHCEIEKNFADEAAVGGFDCWTTEMDIVAEDESGQACIDAGTAESTGQYCS